MWALPWPARRGSSTRWLRTTSNGSHSVTSSLPPTTRCRSEFSWRCGRWTGRCGGPGGWVTADGGQRRGSSWSDQPARTTPPTPWCWSRGWVQPWRCVVGALGRWSCRQPSPWGSSPWSWPTSPVICWRPARRGRTSRRRVGPSTTSASMRCVRSCSWHPMPLTGCRRSRTWGSSCAARRRGRAVPTWGSWRQRACWCSLFVAFGVSAGTATSRATRIPTRRATGSTVGWR